MSGSMWKSQVERWKDIHETKKIHAFSGQYSVGVIIKGYPETWKGYKSIKTARAGAYKDTMEIKEPVYLFVPCGYRTSDGKKVITHYAPIGRVYMNRSKEVLWDNLETKQSNILHKDGSLGGRF